MTKGQVGARHVAMQLGQIQPPPRGCRVLTDGRVVTGIQFRPKEGKALVSGYTRGNVPFVISAPLVLAGL